MARHGIIFLILLFSFQILEAQGVSLRNAFPSLTFHHPLFLTHSGDRSNRIFVVSQDGLIRVFPNDSSVTSSRVFLDISSKLSASKGEEGLLGLAFPPDFRTSRVFYVDYTTPSSKPGSALKIVIARYSVSLSDSNQADTASEERILEIEHPFHNHNGGMIAFGPDSALYIGVGDGGSENDPLNNGQSLLTGLGKILRIDVRGKSGYSIPRDNPFARTGAPYKREIWAYGLRNPWRFSFDAVTGQLWAGDVGQDTREEVDIIRCGGNYGWRIMEGTICRPGGRSCDSTGLTMPIVDYGHDIGDAITGGYVYRGSSLPQLQGAYIFGDFGSGRIFLLRYEAGKVTADSTLLRTSIAISSFGVDEQNELYVVGYDKGTVMKLARQPVQTSVSTSEVPLHFALDQNYPNPFNPVTIIKYTVGGVRDQGPGVSKDGTRDSGLGTRRIMLVVYDVLGRQVATLVDEEKAPGSYEVRFDGSRLASGVYYYRLTAGSYVESRKMILVK